MNNTRYRNRILSRLPAYAWPVVIFSLLFFVLMVWPGLPAALRLLTGFLFFATVICSLWLIYCHRTFAYNSGQLEAKLLADLPGRLQAERAGDLLDIGTGSGYLAITFARLFHDFRVIGLLFPESSATGDLDRCYKNAAAEGVKDRVAFTRGKATDLPFAPECFDAVISGYAFKDIKNGQDRRVALMEALRVCKTGGSFAFQDFFGRPELYGDVTELVAGLKAAGLKEIHFVPDLDRADFVPPLIQTTGLLKGAGLIYGIK